ncbi:MAG: CDP-alcohol phosphatidyltransferase family protein [Candidatus Omnitrophota bacterium]
MNLLANLLTSASLLLGFASLLFSLRHDFTFACWSIIIAVVLDGLDGQVARKNPVPSPFGKEFDSLVDVVSFGIAPAIAGYMFIYRDFYLYAAAALFLYLFSSVVRLAKYNITPKAELVNYFYGLPTTASGGMLASFILIFRKKEGILLPVSLPIIFMVLVLLLAFLMVSKARYLNLDGLKGLFGGKAKFWLLILGILLILAFFSRKAGVSIFMLFSIYLIFSPFVVKRLNSNL